MNIFAVYKPKGPSSYSLIAQIKKATGEQRVGHAGTLDPLAEGILVVGLGREATRQLDNIVRGEKEYVADIKLGISSTTDDEEGIKHIMQNIKHITRNEVSSSISKFIGVINQIPPVYSAIKVHGRRSYKLARNGESIELQARPVEIKSIKILKYKFPDLQIKVVCGSGVYIRSLARDIGTSLNTGAYMSGLKRTKVGDFNLKKTLSVDELSKKYFKQQIDILKKGGIGVVPTDTIYGLVGKALNKNTVERIYKVRKRSPDKPLIILISQISDLNKFGVKIDNKTKKILQKYWPGQVSVILGCHKKLDYLHRGTNSLAFRLPDNKWLRFLLRKTGPLVAPSANPEGLDPALTIRQAKKYFSNMVDFYIDRGKLESSPSTLVKIEAGNIIVLREGVVVIKK
ncbi:tRNA pseudouridine(55) synthase TruB [Candidatus Falkowbacteria bacterium]|uniref:tRNA pseudouridine synthase B n=1 Tax=Candidatus Buchananbacteria bacterium CG10_big_fil_rev_8_21_14_0_10_33_19 TaxID=1974525 RepID=A0A2H0W3V1_9BACT|nr:tRNA pseudouridine(55) synthase TruB [Candidatus Falkowbacteria bacterium]PIS06042.1 MAG: hypothetical protein COT80_04735 [Candidatus Buchananbacteria bacterium CG10_big_fil_rev_8_21_14_0_10_33_19]